MGRRCRVQIDAVKVELGRLFRARGQHHRVALGMVREGHHEARSPTHVQRCARAGVGVNGVQGDGGFCTRASLHDVGKDESVASGAVRVHPGFGAVETVEVGGCRTGDRLQALYGAGLRVDADAIEVSQLGAREQGHYSDIRLGAGRCKQGRRLLRGRCFRRCCSSTC